MDAGTIMSTEQRRWREMVRDVDSLRSTMAEASAAWNAAHHGKVIMKLTELEPRWFSAGESSGIAGISFQCPHCAGLPAGDPNKSRLGVRIDHSAPHIISVTGDPAITHIPTNQQVWQISGDVPSFDGEIHGGFDNVTLTPSVDASKLGHWHGYIVAGEIK